jgi:methyl-accepting chemotaxis protein
MVKNFLASLGGRILLVISLAIVLTLTAALFVIHNRYLSFSKEDTEKELKSLLVQAESTTDSIGHLAEACAFNYTDLARELEAKGRDNYRDTTFYKTVPVVAAWEAIKKTIEGTDTKFRIVRDSPRNKENLPKSELERRILNAVEKEGKSEIFIEDKDAGVFAYGRPGDHVLKVVWPATAIRQTAAPEMEKMCSDSKWKAGKPVSVAELIF